MEDSVKETPSDSFKIPQLLNPDGPESIKTSASRNVASSEAKTVNKLDSKIVNKNVAKNRVDVPLPYTEPTWSGSPPSTYSFEIIKGGTFVESYKIESSLVVFGRLDVCNIVFEHPSVSRYHAVVQFCDGDSSHPKGFYLYDLGSTHGTFLNKEKITPKIYYKLKVGYIVKFGGSSRLHIFEGPEEEEVEEKPKSPKPVEDICSWGMGEDADEEEDLSENPFAFSTPNEELYLDDPKKTLRNWFEREGYELEYDVEEKGLKTFVCRIRLPVDTNTGDYMPVEASVSGKKKEAVIACALEACRTLDRLGLLRPSHQESRYRKKKKWEENDYYDSDEDTFLDRTGTIEKKREMRKRSENKSGAETYESIETKLKAVTEEIDEITKKLSVHKADSNLMKKSEVDTLEAYMSSLCDSKDMASDKIERRKHRFRLQEAEKEKAHLEKLLNIAKPTTLPPVVKYPGMIGKKLKSKLKIPPSTSKAIATPIVELNENEEEVEESETENMEVTDYSVENTSPEISGKKDSSTKNPEVENVKKYGLILNVKEKDRQMIIGSKKEIKSDSEEETELDSESASLKKPIVGCKKPLELSKEGASVSKKKKGEKSVESKVDVYAVGNAEYSTWMPPSGQTGDGMTHLNAKYGY